MTHDPSLFPHYHLVPKDHRGQVEYRDHLIDLTRDDPEEKRKFRKMCEEDFLFHVNTLGWVHEPREMDGARDIIFNTYPFQDRVAERLIRILGRKNCVIKKPRTMGISWLVLHMLKWACDTWKSAAFRMASRTQDMVDSREDMDALFPKLDYIQAQIPPHLQDPYSRTFAHYYNQRTRSSIDGTATVKNMGRGGRRTVFFPDEFSHMDNSMQIVAATASNTNCRIFNGTPSHIGHAMYAMMDNPAYEQIEMDWWEHPVYRRGLYRGEGGKLVIEDPDYEFPADYEFVLDDEYPRRSPWFDQMCHMLLNNRALINREIMCNWQESGAQFVDQALIDDCLQRTRTPSKVGMLRIDRINAEVLGYFDRPGGKLSLWVDLDRTGGKPVSDRYILGCDVAAGSGATYSCVTVVRRSDGHKLCEYVDNDISVGDFAVTAAAMGRWFSEASGHPALLLWENNGFAGQSFTKCILELKYQNLFRMPRDPTDLNKGISQKYGWTQSLPTKKTLLENYCRRLGDRTFYNPSAASIRELQCYEWDKTGKYVAHNQALTSEDPTGKNENHGDRAIADALACWPLTKTTHAEPRKTDIIAKWRNPPRGSFAERMDEELREQMIEELSRR